MSTRRAALGAAGAVFLAGASGGKAVAQSGDVLQDVTTELLRWEDQVIAALVRGDSTVLQRDFAPESIHTNFVGGRSDKHQEIYEFYAPDRFKLEGGDIANPLVRVYGQVAILWADLTWRGATYTPPGHAPLDLSGVYAVTHVFRRGGDRWLLVTAHASRRPTNALQAAARTPKSTPNATSQPGRSNSA
jgi:hypothetical protein